MICDKMAKSTTLNMLSSSGGVLEMSRDSWEQLSLLSSICIPMAGELHGVYYCRPLICGKINPTTLKIWCLGSQQNCICCIAYCIFQPMNLENP